MTEDASSESGGQAERPARPGNDGPRPAADAPWRRMDGIDGGAQAAWCGTAPSVQADPLALAVAGAEADVAAQAEAAAPSGYGDQDAPAPWFDGPQAAWAGEAPPPGIHLTLPLETPAEAGAKSVLLEAAPPTSGAGQLQAGAFVSLIRPGYGPSARYAVRSGYVSGRKRVPLRPSIRDQDEGASQLATAGEPVPDIALGRRPPAWWGGYARPDDQADPIRAIIPPSLPGSHVRLGWGNASLTIGGMGYGS
jgi:hypothetical protein